MIARSIRGALKTYLRKNRGLRHGDMIAVKLRGVGSWEDFKVSR